jgi:Fe-S-cluster containining protein
MDEPALLLFDNLSSGNSVRGKELIKTELQVAEKLVPLAIRIPDKPIPLSDIVPLARAICDTLCSVVLSSLASYGNFIPCRKGCCVCCRYLVTLSMPEVYRFRQEFAEMTGRNRIPILRSCLSSAQKILASAASADADDIRRLSQWYWQLDIKCPFLHNGICSIYTTRPLACREHFVTTPPILCSPGSLCEPSIVPMPVSILEALGQLAAELEQKEVEAVMLPLAFAALEQDDTRCRRTWPAEYMIKRFVQILQTIASGHSVERLHQN